MLVTLGCPGQGAGLCDTNSTANKLTPNTVEVHVVITQKIACGPSKASTGASTWHTGRRFQSESTLQDIEIGQICPDLEV